MTTLKALNPKNQKLVNKATDWLIKYNNASDLRTKASDNLYEDEYEEDSKEWRKHNRAAERAFDMFLGYMDELPKKEQKQIYKSELY